MSFFLVSLVQFFVMCSMFLLGFFDEGPRMLQTILSYWWWVLIYWIFSFTLMGYGSWKERKEEREFEKRLIEFEEDIARQEKLFGLTNELRQ